MDKHAILVDFQTGGHHGTYAAFAERWLREEGWGVQRLEWFQPDIEAMYRRAGKFGCRIEFWRSLKQRASVDEKAVICFLYWDDIKPFWLPASARHQLMKNPVVGIWMNTWGFRAPGKLSISGVRLRRYPFLRDSSLSLVILDEELLPELRRRSKSKLGFLPDFAVFAPRVDCPQARFLAEFKGARQLCLMIGAISGAKNPELFEAVARSADPHQWAFAVVGEFFVPGLEERLRDLGHVAVCPGRVGSEGEYDAILSQATVLWGVYPRWEGSSNLITKAGMAGIPVLVSRGFLAEQRVTRYQLGFTVSDSSPEETLERLQSWHRDAWAGPGAQFVLDFSVERAKAAMIALVNSSVVPRATRKRGLFLIGLLLVVQRIINVAKQILKPKARS